MPYNYTFGFVIIITQRHFVVKWLPNECFSFFAVNLFWTVLELESRLKKPKEYFLFFFMEGLFSIKKVQFQGQLLKETTDST